MTDFLSPLVDSVVSLVSLWGAPGVALAVALENLFPPIPSEVILPAAGFAAASGSMSVVAAIVWASLGSLVGALALYGLGAAWGRERFRRVTARVPGLSLDDIDRAEDWLARRGRAAVFLGRLVPVVRSLISLPAGIERMPLGVFALYTTAGSAVWNSLLVGAGYALGSRWNEVEVWISRYQTFVFLAAGIALALWVTTRVRDRRKARNRHENERNATSTV